jgi:hypothetical protein
MQTPREELMERINGIINGTLPRPITGQSARWIMLDDPFAGRIEIPEPKPKPKPHDRTDKPWYDRR